MSTTYYSQPGIINAVDPLIVIGGTAYGLVADDPSTGTAQRNTVVMRGLIGLANNMCAQSISYGTTILIPGHTIPLGPAYTGPITDVGSTYYFQKLPSDTATAVVNVSCNWPIRFLGTGSTVLHMLEDADGGFSDFFQVVTSGAGMGDHTGGITFEDLYFTYPNITGTLTTAAIHVPFEGAENVRVVRCSFVDCPRGLILEDGLEMSVIQCKFNYPNNVGTSITLGNNVPGGSAGGGGAAKQVWIAGSLFYADHSNGQKGSTGILIYGVEHINIADTRIDSYTYGLKIVPGPGFNSVRCNFTNLDIYSGDDADGNSGTAVTIQPQASVGGGVSNVAQISFTSCAFEFGETATLTMHKMGSPGVLIDATNGIVDNVRFVSCYSTRWAGPGLEVAGGATNIEVVGGFYSGNNYTANSFSASNPVGIHLVNATGVRIVGAACKGKYQWITISQNMGSTATQTYGIYLESGASNVIIDGCDVTENGDAGIYVEGGAEEVIIDSCDLNGNVVNGIVVNAASTAVTRIFIRDCDVTQYGSYGSAIKVMTTGTNAASVEVTNCAGYNNQGVEVSGAPISVSPGSLFYAYQYGYYGPVTFYLATAVTNVKIGGTVTTLKSGTFDLPPSVSGELIGTVAVSITMIGK